MTITKHQLQSIGTNRYRLPKAGDMRIPADVYANGAIFNLLEDESLTQLANAASLRGVRYVAGMPDIHVGYGVPVGCVMAMDDVEGLISAGAVGMDVNCGVRLLTTNIPASQLDPDILKDLGRAILRRIPVGIGTNGPHQDDLNSHTKDILLHGVEPLDELGFARSEDLNRIQDGGKYPGARLDGITSDAWDRLDQFSTLGGGNHFMEIVEFDEVYDSDTAREFRTDEGNIGVLIHTGSRGFGHQTCVDYSDRMLDHAPEFDLSFPDDNLAAAPINSDIGREYLGAMGCAANVAYANRQMMTHDIRQAFREVLGSRNPVLDVVYDITHNLARFETVGDSRYLIHRKGAVRALPAGHADNPECYMNTGHPVLVPGNMGTGSYVMKAGTNIRETFHSINHGAGRRMSRNDAKDTITEDMMMEAIGNGQLLGASRNKIRDEAPQAYKDIHQVINILNSIDIAESVTHMKPLVTMKGN